MNSSAVRRGRRVSTGVDKEQIISALLHKCGLLDETTSRLRSRSLFEGLTPLAGGRGRLKPACAGEDKAKIRIRQNTEAGSCLVRLLS